MQALALLDINSEFGKNVVDQLPEYFTEEEQPGPVPMSVLQQEAQDKDGFREDLVTDGVCDQFQIPVIRYSLPGDETGAKSPTIPEELGSLKRIQPKQGFGQVFEVNGQKLVLVENCAPDGLWFAPLECIALDR